MKKAKSIPSLSFVLVTSFLAACAHGPQPGFSSDRPAFDEAQYQRVVETLASDGMQGRGITTEGNERATAFLEGAFKESGLMPGGTEGSYRQCFDQPVSVRAEKVSLVLNDNSIPTQTMSPAPFSGSGAFEGELVFGGYGIHAPDEGYDDYSALDPKGKVLLLFRYEPRERDPKSSLNGDRPSRHSELRRKVFEARNRGARAILLVAPPREGDEPDEKVPALLGAEAQSQAGLPVLYLLPSQVNAWLKPAQTTLADLVQQIDSSFASQSLSLGRIQGEVRVERKTKRLCNVIGLLPGDGSLTDEAVVIGAHFDHLGFGQQGTMAPGEKAIHPGADDNASGTAGLISLAKLFAKSRQPGNRRTLVFVAFNAEEVGLAGSSSYVSQPAKPLEKTSAMINMDMIGRLREGRLVVMGTETGDQWAEWLPITAKATGLEYKAHGDGYGPSDHTPFYSHGVPVLHFFTGAHEDHHKPSDTSDKVNYAGARQILQMVADLVHRISLAPSRVAYLETSGGSVLAGDSRSYGAWLGSIPDFTSMSPGASGGVLLSGVRKGGPASKAGIQAKDRIVSMAGTRIDNLYDMTFVLRDHRPGEVIQIVVLREGKRVELAATLGSRGEMGQGAGGHAGPGKKSGHPGGIPHGASGKPEDPHHGHPGGHTGTTAEVSSSDQLDPKTLLYPGEEKHLKNVRQLTFGGENAEGYFSPDGKKLVFQARGGDVKCDRIYSMDLTSGKVDQVSNGKGRTTCAYYTYPKGDAIFYASTHLGGDACPPTPDYSQGYVWPIYDTFDLFLKRPGQPVERLTDAPGYDAEATACFVDGRIVFTSVRDGDLDLYVMDLAKPKRAPVRITDQPGYDGGAFFSPDCSRLVWRASRHEGKKLESYRALLKRNLVRPHNMEIVVSDGDGKNAKQVTRNGAANFAPYFLPDNRRVIFASNMADPGGHNFDLYVIDPEGDDPAQTLVRITYSPVFEAFPMFSPDGKKLVFGSNRNQKIEGETNLFIADWVD